MPAAEGGAGFDVRSVRVDTAAQARALMAALGVHPGGVALMAPKFTARAFLVKGLKAPAANIVKQEALAAGADAAVHKDVITCRVERSDALIFGTAAALVALAGKLRHQGFGLCALGDKLEALVTGWNSRHTLALKGSEYDLRRPLVMGILNVTPDSFSDGGKYIDPAAAAARGREMIAQGADLVDVGGESTRPGASYVTEAEELARVLPTVTALAADVLVSVDTRRAAVARAAAAEGAAMINDVAAGCDEPAIAAVCAEYDLPYVVMHMKGTPADMQLEPHYDDVVGEVRDYLAARAAWARAEGVRQVVVDPGIGFGKTLEHNLELLRNVPALCDLGYPVMVGHSRKRFLGDLTGAPTEERLGGSVAAALAAARRGANILRVHDVKETAQALAVVRALSGEEADV
jgi:dihydropteroate synthase